MTEIPNPHHPVPPTAAERLSRALYMILFAVAHQVIHSIIVVIAIVQFLFDVFSGKSIPGLREFGARLALYNADIIEFLSYKSNAKPWPLAPFPPGDDKIRGEE